jgi:3-hydroxyisobutyrate dehydrogenase-like beta-hydroxyacid dehydrogenase
MSEITRIGLGAMGTEIGLALLENKVELTVWNRSPEKAETLGNLGANVSSSLEAAIEASPRIMVCITEYDASLKLLNQPSITAILLGKNIIQFSTGTPDEVRKTSKWMNDQGASYIDGSIMVYPVTIGEEAGQILVSGGKTIFHDCEAYINCLGVMFGMLVRI